MDREYEEGLYRCYVAGGDPWDLPQGQTHYLEYDRDPAAERAVAAWERVVAAWNPDGNSGDDVSNFLATVADIIEAKEAANAVQTD